MKEINVGVNVQFTVRFWDEKWFKALAEEYPKYFCDVEKTQEAHAENICKMLTSAGHLESGTYLEGYGEFVRKDGGRTVLIVNDEEKISISFEDIEADTAV